MRRKNGERVHGPYKHRNRWRVILAGPGDRQEAVSFDTEAEARRFKAKTLKELAGRTVSEAVQAYLASLRERGLRASTVVRAESHLRRFFDLDEIEGDERVKFARAGGLLEDLRSKQCGERYAALRVQVTVDTHRNALAAARAFGAWCVEEKWLRENPAASVKPIGQRNRGKPQLRIDEARKLVDLCLRKADLGHEGAIAVLTALFLGLRASEVTDRVVRDLDDGGRLLWIPVGKTRRSRRTLEVPELLRPYLQRLATKRGPEEQLITRTTTKNGRRRDRYWLLRVLQGLCKEAGVPAVCTHSLRGLHATLATEAGATPHLVASALGHSSPQVTAMHYTDPTTADRARTRKVLGRLAEPVTGSSVPVTPVGNG